MAKKLLPDNISLFIKSIFISIIGIFITFLGILSTLFLIFSNKYLSSFMISSSLGKVFLLNYFTDTLNFIIGFIPSLFLFLFISTLGILLIILRNFNQIPYDYFFLKTILTIYIGSSSLGLIFKNYGGVIGYTINKDLSFFPVIIKIILGIFLLSIFFLFSFDLLFIDKYKLFKFLKSIFNFIYKLFYKSSNDNIENISFIKNKNRKKTKKNIKQKEIQIKKDIKEDIKKYSLPPPEYLEISIFNKNIITNELKRTAEALESKFEEFGVLGHVVGIKPGPIVTLYQFEPNSGVRIAKITDTVKDITRAMAAESIRMAHISRTNYIGVEIVNLKDETVRFRSLINNPSFINSKYKIPLALGVDIGGTPMYFDLAKMPHLLIAGRTGSGKSVFIQSLILSILYKFTPDRCKLIIIDPKGVDFTLWDNIPHLISPVLTDSQESVNALKWCVIEMENRFKKLKELGVQNIEGYNEEILRLRNSNEKLTKKIVSGRDENTGEFIYEDINIDLIEMPYLVIIIDEVADLMTVAKKDVEMYVQRLAQKARAAGIHLIAATQRPDTTVITGVIKANFPTRISFQARSSIDSMTTLGEKGAEQLISRGDLLFSEAGRTPVRIHGALIENTEINKVALFLREQGSPEFINIENEENKENSYSFIGGDKNNDLYEQAKEIVINDKKPSISYLQRRLGIGYNKAANLIEKMEEEGIISAPDSTNKRHIL